MCVHSWTLSLKMSLYLEIASKEHLTPIAASATFSNARRPLWTQPSSVPPTCMCVLNLCTPMCWGSVLLDLCCLYLALDIFQLAVLQLCNAVQHHTAALHALLLLRLLTRKLTHGHTHTHLCALATNIELAGQQPLTQCLEAPYVQKKEPVTTHGDTVCEGETGGCDHTYACPNKAGCCFPHLPRGAVHYMASVYSFNHISFSSITSNLARQLHY